MKQLGKIAKKFGLDERDLFFYGEKFAKIQSQTFAKFSDHRDGKLILVTAISPTPAGEGKTTISIGLADAMNRISRKRTVLALREPSMGPVFGMKGGAVGGGMSRLASGEEINLNFTGDLAAIESANNLLAALIDNHLYWGNKMEIDRKKILFKRCVDINDRALREIRENSAGDLKDTRDSDRFSEFNSGFNITAASEVMAALCLAEDLADLKRRFSRILVAFSKKGKPIFAGDLHAEDAMTIIMKRAIDPNLVQTLDGTLALIHGGPFANIAHGASSIRSIKFAKKLGDYVVTESGFGADLGAEKFVDIVSRVGKIKPDVVVLVASVKALKYNGGATLTELNDENITALEIGLDNIRAHVIALKKFNLPVVIAINKFADDTERELEFIGNFAKTLGVKCEVADVFSRRSKSGENGENLARIVMKTASSSARKDEDLKFAYELGDPIREKFLRVAQQVYGAENVEFSDTANSQIAQIESNAELDFAKTLPICIAKTQYSLSDDSNKLTKSLRENPKFTLHIREIEINSGAGFLVGIAGKIYRMPGLPRIPASDKMHISADGEIFGLK